MVSRIIFALGAAGVAARNSLARTPPMGWMSWEVSPPSFFFALRLLSRLILARTRPQRSGMARARIGWEWRAPFCTNLITRTPPPLFATCAPEQIFRCRLATPTDDCTNKANTSCISEALYQGITDAVVSSGLAAAGYAVR